VIKSDNIKYDLFLFFITGSELLRILLLWSAILILYSLMSQNLFADEFPELPEKNHHLLIPAQEWPLKPGPRTVKVYLHYPGKELKNVSSQTGLMLNLHNWGGTYHTGAANPQELADRYHVIVICVDYLQSGNQRQKMLPYDFGYLQSLDALRSLYFVYNGLNIKEIAFASDRIYCTGGSGGGNITLMTNKLAPRTFACSVDISGMAKLTDDIAFGLPEGSILNAKYSQDSDKPNYLSPDRKQLHFVGDPQHLEVMKQLGNQNKLIVVHGKTDEACLFLDVEEMVKNYQSAQLDVEPHFIDEKNSEGSVFKNSGHSLGDRTSILFKVADQYILPDGKNARKLNGPTDFERKEIIKYPTANGVYEISYKKGYPVGRFVPIPR
jgi:predicted esterase